MKSSKLYVTVILLFMGFSIYAQKVHYKDNYYTIVKSKIFHRGHDVYGKLTSGARDTIHLIAKELYTERGKLKEKYKNVPRRERYKLPEGFWKEKVSTPSNDTAVAVKVTTEENTTEAKATNVVQQINPTEKVTAVTANEVSNNMTKKVVEEREKETEKVVSPDENDKKVSKEKSDTKLTVNADRKKEEEVEKREQREVKEQKKEKEEKKEALEEKITQQKEDKKNAIARLATEKAASEQAQREKEQQQREDKKNAIAKLENEKVAREQAQKKKEQEALEAEREKAARKKEKALKKKEKEEKEREREQKKIEKEKKRKEKELKQKEKAISNHKSAQKKLEKAEKKYKKLKEKGELSPIEEAEWLEKIEKLKEKVTKREKQLRK